MQSKPYLKACSYPVKCERLEGSIGHVYVAHGSRPPTVISLAYQVCVDYHHRACLPHHRSLASHGPHTSRRARGACHDGGPRIQPDLGGVPLRVSQASLRPQPFPASSAGGSLGDKGWVHTMVRSRCHSPTRCARETFPSGNLVCRIDDSVVYYMSDACYFL